MKTKSALLLATIFMSLNAFGQAHLHGAGKLFVAQDANRWQLQFTLPAADIIGFEHQPSNDIQLSQATSQTDKLASLNSLFITPQACSIATSNVTLPFDLTLNKAHKHDKKHSHKHDKSDAHHDIQATFVLECQSTIRHIDITIFESYPSLEMLEVLKATESGQSSEAISANNSKVLLG